MLLGCREGATLRVAGSGTGVHSSTMHCTLPALPAGCRQDAMRVHAGLSAALRAAQPQRAKWPQITYKPE